jgi:hypothetical protein
MTSAAHPNGRTGLVAKLAAGLCFAIAVGLLIASLLYPQPARAAHKAAHAHSAAPAVR